jgi:hypothetical protein
MDISMRYSHRASFLAKSASIFIDDQYSLPRFKTPCTGMEVAKELLAIDYIFGCAFVRSDAETVDKQKFGDSTLRHGRRDLSNGYTSSCECTFHSVLHTPSPGSFDMRPKLKVTHASAGNSASE